MPQRIEQPIRELTKRYRALSPAARRAVWALVAFEAVRLRSPARALSSSVPADLIVLALES